MEDIIIYYFSFGCFLTFCLFIHSKTVHTSQTFWNICFKRVALFLSKRLKPGSPWHQSFWSIRRLFRSCSGLCAGSCAGSCSKLVSLLGPAVFNGAECAVIPVGAGTGVHRIGDLQKSCPAQPHLKLGSTRGGFLSRWIGVGTWWWGWLRFMLFDQPLSGCERVKGCSFSDTVSKSSDRWCFFLP